MEGEKGGINNIIKIVIQMTGLSQILLCVRVQGSTPKIDAIIYKEFGALEVQKHAPVISQFY